MFEGPDLRGFNHEVKVAAEKAGFNIWNHDGLYNLIWAVKRVALRASRNANIEQKPFKDPVYPDRFRPSGFRDNTKRKRPDQAPPPPDTVPIALDPVASVSQSGRRSFRYKNKKIPAARKMVNGAVDWDRIGTQEHPIELLYDEDDDASTPLAKRQRVDVDATSNNRQVANTSIPRTAPEASPTTSRPTGKLNRPLTGIARGSMQIGGYTYIPTNISSEERFASGPDIDRAQSRILDNQLTKVESALEGAANHMTWCNKSMSATFISHREVMAAPHIHPLLEDLNANIENAKKAASEGAKILRDVRELV